MWSKPTDASTQCEKPDGTARRPPPSTTLAWQGTWQAGSGMAWAWAWREAADLRPYLGSRFA